MLRFFLRGMLGMVRVWLIVAVALLTVIGALAVADIWATPHLPHICRAAHPPAPWRTLPRISFGQLAALDDGGRWGQLQPSLQILDEVCPEVAAFTRERWESGHLVFEAEERGRYAAWYILPRTLVINYAAWERGDVELACTLAHEYRHSRQGIFRGLQAGIGRMFGVDRSDLLEPEAYAWEAEIRRAIHRRN